MKPRNDGGDPSNSFMFPGVDPSAEKECNWLRKDLIAARKAIGELHDELATLRAENERLREALEMIRTQPQGHTAEHMPNDVAAMARIARSALAKDGGE